VAACVGGEPQRPQRLAPRPRLLSPGVGWGGAAPPRMALVSRRAAKLPVAPAGGVSPAGDAGKPRKPPPKVKVCPPRGVEDTGGCVTPRPPARPHPIGCIRRTLLFSWALRAEALAAAVVPVCPRADLTVKLNPAATVWGACT
jgi:hypothetical protein